MVSYPEWTKIVHQEYKTAGGTYDGGNIVTAITKAASEWWNENKETIIELAVDAARRFARELIQQYIDERGQFP